MDIAARLVSTNLLCIGVITAVDEDCCCAIATNLLCIGVIPAVDGDCCLASLYKPVSGVVKHGLQLLPERGELYDDMVIVGQCHISRGKTCPQRSRNIDLKNNNSDINEFIELIYWGKKGLQIIFVENPIFI